MLYISALSATKSNPYQVLALLLGPQISSHPPLFSGWSQHGQEEGSVSREMRDPGQKEGEVTHATRTRGQP